ncbi:MAG: glycosyl transferase family 1 [Candidatus Taylorbacteria bacterium]|nr:glycosyl transferase family 1 [Candidatus Taylorbacteria bacterium]
MKNTITAYWRKISKRLFGSITLHPQGVKPRGRVLISYILEPFLLLPHEKLSTRHSNYFECKTIVEYFLNKGYIVQVIDARNSAFIPKKKYSYVLDIGHNLERFKPYLKEAVTIHHATTSYWKFNNTAEFLRLSAFKQRNGEYLKPQRGLPESKNFEIADFVFGFGNEHTVNTFPESNKITLLPQSLPAIFYLPKRDWNEAQHHFLWLSGGGAVHKGLDLLLEIFRSHPDLLLHICGPVKAEKDFVSFYRKELFETPNIIYHGRVDIESEKFKEIHTKCGFIIYPSCSEGQSGAVLVAMSTGLIPIISKETGVTIGNKGYILQKSFIKDIEEALKWTRKLTPITLEDMSKKVYTKTTDTYGQKQFATALKEYFDAIVQ